MRYSGHLVFALRTALGLGALLAAPLASHAQPRGVTNARLESRSAAGGLAAVVKAEVAARPGPVWIGWSVPTALEHSACCWDSDEAGDRGCRGCRLERDGGSFTTNANSEAHLEARGLVRVLIRAEGGSIGRIRAVSEDCPVDAGGRPLVWIEAVRPEASVALLSDLVGQPKPGSGASGDRRGRERGHGDEVVDGALAAIAFHADPSADQALERLVAAGQPLEQRKKAAFWIGQARGARGYEVLKRLVREDDDRRFREHAVFALSQSREPGAVDVIIQVARRDEDAHVRGQALFWLAQTASRRASTTIRSAIEDDPEVEVKKKAVFALSQLPKDEGVPLLIGVAKGHKSPEVRKQAMFWLGQSGDPRALAFFEDVLAR